MSLTVSQANIHPFPASAAGHRLVPASVGAAGRAQIVHVDCPSYCVVDHVERRELTVEDITHFGRGAVIQLPVGDAELYLNVIAEPSDPDPFRRAAHLVVSDGVDEEHLTRDRVEALADHLADVAVTLQQMLSTCLSDGDSDPDMDVALRRVRGGAA